METQWVENVEISVRLPWGESEQGFLENGSIWKPQDPNPGERVQGKVFFHDFISSSQNESRLHNPYNVEHADGHYYYRYAIFSIDNHSLEDYLIGRIDHITLRHSNLQYKDAVEPKQRIPMTLTVFKELHPLRIMRRFGNETPVIVRIRYTSERIVIADATKWSPNRFTKGNDYEAHFILKDIDAVINEPEFVAFHFPYTIEGYPKQELYTIIKVSRDDLLQWLHGNKHFVFGIIR